MCGIPSVGRSTRSCDWNHSDAQVCTDGIVMLRVTRCRTCIQELRKSLVAGLLWASSTELIGITKHRDCGHCLRCQALRFLLVTARKPPVPLKPPSRSTTRSFLANDEAL